MDIEESRTEINIEETITPEKTRNLYKFVSYKTVCLFICLLLTSLIASQTFNLRTESDQDAIDSNQVLIEEPVTQDLNRKNVQFIGDIREISQTNPKISEGTEEKTKQTEDEEEEDRSETNEILNRSRRIINPIETEPNSAVFIEINKDHFQGVGSCTGSILSSRIILTAAHCFVSRGQSVHTVPSENQLSHVESIAIYAGLSKTDMSNFIGSRSSHLHGNEQVINLSYSDIRRYGINQLIKVNDHWYHSLHDKKIYHLKHGDIALIVLPETEELELERLGIQPLGIYAPTWFTTPPTSQIKSSGGEWRIEGRKATAVGYGRTSIYDEQRKGLGKNYFIIKTKKQCTSHIRDIGWDSDDDLMNIQDVFCASGPRTPERSQVCSGDSGGPLYIDGKFIELRRKTELYEITEQVQLGVTIWVDSKCKANFNGFIEISKYLDWVEASIDSDLFDDIESRIKPTRKNVNLYTKYRKIIEDWRKENQMTDEIDGGMKNSIEDSYRFGTPGLADGEVTNFSDSF